MRDTNGLMNPSASTNASPGTSPSLVRAPAIRPPSATSPSTVTPNRKSTLSDSRQCSARLRLNIRASPLWSVGE